MFFRIDAFAKRLMQENRALDMERDFRGWLSPHLPKGDRDRLRKNPPIFQSLSLTILMVAPSSSPPTNPEYDARVTEAIAILRQELPTLFDRDISYDIYRNDIKFTDPVNRFKGKFNYRIIFWTLRFHAQLFFTEIAFDLHRVDRDTPNTIVAEWTVRGILRLPWKPKLFFNGSSTYTLDEDGSIYDHVDTWDRKPGEILKQFIWGDRAS